MKVKGWKSTGIYNISRKLLKAGGKAMIHELHAVLSGVRQSVAIHLTGKEDWLFLSGGGKEIKRTATVTMV